MALLTSQVAGSGLDYGVAAADAGGDSGVLTGKEVLMVHNASGAQRTVTLANVALSNHGEDTNVVKTVEDGKTLLLPLRNKGRFADPDNNDQASWTYDSATSVTVALIQVP